MYKFLPILLFAYGLAVTTDEIYNDSWAVIIGINEYEHVDQLNYAVQDAEAIKNLLISSFNFPKEHIIMLTDKEATLDNIRTKLFEVAISVNEGDRLLVYYAGHGDTYNLKSGGERGYLIPVDGDLDNIFATCLPMSDIKEVASVTAAKHVLFLMDACYGGLLAVDARSISKTTSGYIDKITRDNARQIITAGGKGEQVIEKSEWGHSAFAKNLLHGLKTGIADEDSDGYITADELGSFLKKRVTIDSDNFQTPVKRRFGSDEGEFVFINNAYIENQTINITSETAQDEENDIDELRDKITSLEEQLNKPIKFLQGCTDKIAINYNPEANIDDNSCILLDKDDAYIRFGNFNIIDSTLDVFIKSYQEISELEFESEGFKIIDIIDGVLKSNVDLDSYYYQYHFSLISQNIEQGAKYLASSKAGSFKSTIDEILLFRAKVLPISHTFCINNFKIPTAQNIYIGECLTGITSLYREWIDVGDIPNYIFISGINYFENVIKIDVKTTNPINSFNIIISGAEVLKPFGGITAEKGFLLFTKSTNEVYGNGHYAHGIDLNDGLVPAGSHHLISLNVTPIHVGNKICIEKAEFKGSDNKVIFLIEEDNGSCWGGGNESEPLPPNK